LVLSAERFALTRGRSSAAPRPSGAARG
jgi:hypothetical protein